jgi:hypothetical protein
MSEKEKATEKQPESDEKSPEQLSDQALEEVSGGAVAALPTDQFREVLRASPELQEGTLQFKYDLKGNKEG